MMDDFITLCYDTYLIVNPQKKHTLNQRCMYKYIDVYIYVFD